MAFLDICQFLGESFHIYFGRFRNFVDEHAFQGMWYDEQQLCMSLINGMNPETLDLAQYMSNGRLFCMDFIECWNFLCYMNDQCFQVDSMSNASMPMNVSNMSLESMLMEMSKFNEIEPCMHCSSNFHATVSFPLIVLELEKPNDVGF